MGKWRGLPLDRGTGLSLTGAHPATPTTTATLTPSQKPENRVVCLEEFSLHGGGPGALQGISQLIQHQHQSDLVTTAADIGGRN